MLWLLPYEGQPGLAGVPRVRATHPVPNAAFYSHMLQASMDQFAFSIDIKPDTSMRISATLGNIQVGGGAAAGRESHTQSAGRLGCQP